MENDDLGLRLKTIADRFSGQKDHIKTEEATKNALIMPFISALGYDIFNPLEVIPEFTSDVGIKQGEKVDYAIKKDGKIVLLFECKPCATDLDDTHVSQLYRYFSVTEAKIAVLTNGVIYKFYSDLDDSNKMDAKPFYEFNILDIDNDKISDLKKMCKSSFDLDNIVSTAGILKYINGIKQTLRTEFEEPSEDFIKLLVSKVYDGRFVESKRDYFFKIAKIALNQFIAERVKSRLASTLQKTDEDAKEVDNQISQEIQQDDKIVTTEEELQAFYIIRSILVEMPDVFNRLAYKDTQSYFGIMIDNTRGWFCRLYFKPTKKILQIRKDNENCISLDINDICDIYKYKNELMESCKWVMEQR